MKDCQINTVIKILKKELDVGMMPIVFTSGRESARPFRHFNFHSPEPAHKR